jgi:hypothetical protein
MDEQYLKLRNILYIFYIKLFEKFLFAKLDIVMSFVVITGRTDKESIVGNALLF